MSKVFNFKTILLGLILLVAIAAGLLRPAGSASAASTVLVNAANTYQVIDGFGASGAFRTAKYVSGYGSQLTPAQSAEIVELLFSPTTGAGFNIIRQQVGSSTAMVTGVPSTGDGDNLASIEPNNPGGPNATPTYVWDAADPDRGQMWFTQRALEYDPNITVIADAWSAPAYMKTNNALYPGGYLCGAVGAPTCASGDWRQHYANYLAKYVQFYKDEGINIKYIGFGNEPDFSPSSYTGMNWDSTIVSGSRGTLTASMPQSVDFIKNYLGPTLASSGLTTKISCCEATSWDRVATYTTGILADSTAANYVGLITGHGYWGSPNGMITTPINAGGKRVWQTESSNFDAFTAAWDDGSSASGLVWADILHNALTKAQVNGYLYWWFAQRNASNSSNEDLIHMYDTTYTVTKRLWAFANYSRFIRPGATRIAATSDNTNLHITAAKNTNGSYAIVVLNVGTTAETTSFDLTGGNFATLVTPYLTNATNDTAQQSAISATGGAFSATIPARSLVTYYILNGGPTPTPCAACSPTPTKTSTRTITPTPTLCLSCVLRLQYKAGNAAASASEFKPHLRIVNNSASSIPLNALKIRYWYTIDSNQAQSYHCDYAVTGCGNVNGTFGALSPATSTADTYLEIGFTGTGTIAPNNNSGDIQSRINKNDFSVYNQTNDYSFDATKTAYADWNNVTLYYNGALVWGVEPGGVVAPTLTPAISLTPTSGASPTRTLTPLPITFTPTRTLTPAITNTPTRTFTPPVITSTPTRTATLGISPTGTRTNTPTSGASPTRTATVGVSNTPTSGASPTRTPTPGPTSTRTATLAITSTSVVGACSPITSTITAPFTFDGAGTFCWQAATLTTYINSWNTTSVSVNGTNYTNLYATVSSLPAKIGGFWYISYSSSVSFGHFEAKP